MPGSSSNSERPGVTVWVDKRTARGVGFKEHCMNEIDGLLRKTLRCRCFDGPASRPETRSGQDLRSRAAVHGHNFRATKAGRLPAFGKFPVIPCCEGISSRAERADCGLCVRRVRSREEQPDIRRKNRRNIRRKTRYYGANAPRKATGLRLNSVHERIHSPCRFRD